MSVKKGFSIFLLLSAITCGSVLYFSVDRHSWRIFHDADLKRMSLAALLVVCVWLLDALKFKVLTKAAGEWVSYKLALELTWINYFGAAITPFQSGGGPFQIYVLYKHGISVGKSVAITLIRTFFTIMILGLAVPFALMLDHDVGRPNLTFGGFIVYVLIFIGIAWFVVILSFVRPHVIKRWCGKTVMVFKRVGLITPRLVTKTIKRINKEIDAYNHNIKSFFQAGKKYTVLGGVIAFLQTTAQLSVMPCMLWAMHIPVNYVDCILAQALFLFLLYFVPTPGGSGAAEGGAAIVFGLFMPMNVAGMMAVAWRFLTEYTGIFLGTIVAIKMLGWNLAEKIMEKEDEVVEDDSSI